MLGPVGHSAAPPDGPAGPGRQGRSALPVPHVALWSQTMSGNDPRSAPHHTERTVGATTVVELRGEIDIFTAPPLAARLETLTADQHPDLVLDLRSMAFIDRTGLGVLCRARNRVEARDGRLRLVTDSVRSGGSFTSSASQEPSSCTPPCVRPWPVRHRPSPHLPSRVDNSDYVEVIDVGHRAMEAAWPARRRRRCRARHTNRNCCACRRSW
ncbi:STAS domain-containing protein [Streptomyces sp. KR55]|uniref:STAS domain-containing protein n=1 Tax=Streptomyces sp. KR55 TaxID=3457425 RepID=UPI003FD13D90